MSKDIPSDLTWNQNTNMVIPLALPHLCMRWAFTGSLCTMTGEEESKTGEGRRMCKRDCMCGVDDGWSQLPEEPGQTLIFSP